MAAPESRPSKSNWISMNFPNRLLLLLRTVLAFPNDSRIWLDCNDSYTVRPLDLHSP